ncbi:MAG: hypothetical protein EOO38_24260 [Cytophagaceae bacterium]|nr:MAG: hypothetical protein EOO38_24260 [Cytophagaceae bacterium]
MNALVLPVKVLRVPVLLSVNCSNHNFEYTLCSKLCIAVTGEWHCVHNIPEFVVACKLPKPVVKLLEMLTRTRFPADLEELGEVVIRGKKYTWKTDQKGADLPGRSLN